MLYQTPFETEDQLQVYHLLYSRGNDSGQMYDLHCVSSSIKQITVDVLHPGRMNVPTKEV